MEIINNGQPFTLEFVTADEKRGTGGKLIVVKNWMKLREDLPKHLQPDTYKKELQGKKDTQNHRNKLFKIFNPANRSAHPITVHFRLMQSLNGLKIMNG